MTALTGDCDSDDDGSDSEAAAECVRLALRALSGDDLLEWVGVEAGGRIWPNGGVARVTRDRSAALEMMRDEKATARPRTSQRNAGSESRAAECW